MFKQKSQGELQQNQHITHLHCIKLRTIKMETIHRENCSNISRLYLRVHWRSFLGPQFIQTLHHFRCYSGFASTRRTSQTYDISAWSRKWKKIKMWILGRIGIGIKYSNENWKRGNKEAARNPEIYKKISWLNSPHSKINGHWFFLISKYNN